MDTSRQGTTISMNRNASSGVYVGKVNIGCQQFLTGDPACDLGESSLDLIPW